MAYKFEVTPFRFEGNLSNQRNLLIKLLKDSALYTSIELEQDELERCLELLYLFGLRFDEWCVDCNATSIFTLERLIDGETLVKLENLAALAASHATVHEIDHQEVREQLRWLTLTCARNASHAMHFACKLNPKLRRLEKAPPKPYLELEKIGQSPSPADLAKREIHKYSGTLNEPYYSEFNRAIGLASHNIGIGSFVYLRRILERLVDQTMCQVHPDANTRQEIRNLPMADRVKRLSDHLPTFLVENRSVYRILSLGIHELEEHQCLAAFDALKSGIELILDQSLKRKQREQKLDAAAKSLAKLESDLNSGNQ